MKKVLIFVFVFFVWGTSNFIFSQDKDFFTIVYNNLPSDNDLQTDWGFSAWIQMNGKVILFDAGTKPEILNKNLQKLELHPADISVIAVSHEHGDHTGGLESVLEKVSKGTKVYLPNDFNPKLKSSYPQLKFIVNDKFCEIEDGVWLTEIYTDSHFGIREQALVLVKEDKLVVVTGCAHPAINEMCESIVAHFPDKKYELVTGGFHLMSYPEEKIEAISNQIKQLGFNSLAPSHCTGDIPISVFKKEWGENFVQLNLGDSYIF